MSERRQRSVPPPKSSPRAATDEGQEEQRDDERDSKLAPGTSLHAEEAEPVATQQAGSTIEVPEPSDHAAAEPSDPEVQLAGIELMASEDADSEPAAGSETLASESAAGNASNDAASNLEPQQPVELHAIPRDWDTTEAEPDPSDEPGPEHVQRWTARAEAVLGRARDRSEPREQARLTLVASELFAKVGQIERGAALAQEALRLAPSLQLAGKQTRQLAALENDWPSVLERLELESRSGATPEARANASQLAALILETQQQDENAADQKRQAANKTLPSDSRFPIAHLIRTLATTAGDVPSLTIASIDSAWLSTALQQLRALRGGSQQVELPKAAPVLKGLLALRATESWLAQGQVQEAASALLALRELPALKDPILLLAQSLFAQRDTTRRDALACLRELGQEQRALAARVVLARALELRDASALDEALEELPDFDEATRAALRLLFGEDASPVEGWVATRSALDAPDDSRNDGTNDDAHHTSGPAPAWAGAAAASGLHELLASAQPLFERDDLEPSPELRAIRLGEALALEPRVSTAFASVPDAVDEAEGSPLIRLLGADAAAERGCVDDVLAALSELSDVASASGYLRGLFYEASSDLAAAHDAYATDWQTSSVRGAQSDRLLRLASGSERLQWLLRFASESNTPEESAAWFIEALGQLSIESKRSTTDPGLEDAARDQLFEDAFVVPFAAGVATHVAESLARRRGDQAAASAWRQRHRQRCDDRVARAIELVREALAGEGQVEQRIALIDEAVEVKPSNLALNWAREDIAAPRPGERGAWREEVASALDDPAWQSLLRLEAALDFSSSGEPELAHHALGEVDDEHAGPIGLVFKQRFFDQLDPEARAQELLDTVKQASDPLVASSALVELRELAAAADETADTVPWWHAVATRAKEDLHALQRLESAQLLSGELVSVGPLELRLSKILSGKMALASLFVGVQGRIARGLFNSTVAPLDAYIERRTAMIRGGISEKFAALPIWVLQYRGEHARRERDAQRLSTIESVLAEQSINAVDSATHRVRAAEALLDAGDHRGAAETLQTALGELPGHPVAWRLLANAQLALGAPRAATICLERLSEQLQVPEYSAAALTEAGTLLAREGQPEAAEKLLMRAMALDADSDEAFGHLYAVYILKGDQASAYKLADQRLSQLPAQDTPELGVHQARALADLGAQQRAKELLSMTLEANPEHSDALRAFTELCLEQEDWENAEQALLRLSRASQPPERQAKIYRQLADLYELHLDNAPRAKVCLQEVLKRSPNDTETMRRLVRMQVGAGEGDKAVILYKALLTRIPEAEQKPEDLAELARLLEEVTHTPKAAHEVLESGLERWPTAPVLIERWIGLYRHVGQTDAADRIISRSIREHHNALKTGRLEADRFAALATLYRLDGLERAAGLVAQLHEFIELANKPASAPIGRQPDSFVTPGERLALLTHPRVEELATPSMLSHALRQLVRHDAAHFETDMPEPIEPGLDLDDLDSLSDHVRELAQACGLDAVVHVRAVANEAGFIDAWRSEPAEMVVSDALVQRYHAALEASDERVQASIDFLILRALKAIHLQAAALSRLSPIQLSMLIPEWLKAHGGGSDAPDPDQAPMSQLPGVMLPGRPETGEASEWLERLRATPTREQRADLAKEAQTALRGRSSQVGTAIRYLCNRAALAVTLRPSAALEALRSTHVGVSSAANWFMRDPEARDLLVFSAGPNSARMLALDPGEREKSKPHSIPPEPPSEPI